MCHKNSWILTQLLMFKSKTWRSIIATEEKFRQFNWCFWYKVIVDPAVTFYLKWRSTTISRKYLVHSLKMYMISLKENCCDGMTPFKRIPSMWTLCWLLTWVQLSWVVNAFLTNNEYGSSDLATCQEKYLQINDN